MRMRGTCIVVGNPRKSGEQNIAQKIKDRFFHPGIAALGGGDSAFDYLSIFVTHWPSRGEVSSINRKARDRFAHRARERFQREIAIPAILLRKPVDHVAENIDIVGKRQSHHEQLLRINEMIEMQRVADETIECLCHRSFG